MPKALTTYLLRAVPADLWQAARVKANAEQLSMRSVIVALLRAYVDGRVTVRIAARDRRPQYGPKVAV